MTQPKQALGGHINWSVLWYSPKKDKIIEKLCGNDFAEALRVYNLARDGGKQRVTLRSCNVGFPPPESFREIRLIPVEDARGKQKWVRRLVKMVAANKKGIFWCPYCITFRKFEIVQIRQTEWGPEEDESLICPMCGISHRDFHVRKWNPTAARMYGSFRKRRPKKRRRSG